jgi:hypothetical protein
MQTLINGRAYGWSDIKLNILGVLVAGITAINYSDKQEIDNIYGAGNKPVSRGFGRITYEGSITLSMEEVKGLEKISPTGRIQDIPEFTITVAFVPNESTLITTEKLKFVRFKENKRDSKEGDLSIPVEIPLAIGDIIWNA